MWSDLFLWKFPWHSEWGMGCKHPFCQGTDYRVDKSGTGVWNWACGLGPGIGSGHAEQEEEVRPLTPNSCPLLHLPPFQVTVQHLTLHSEFGQTGLTSEIQVGVTLAGLRCPSALRACSLLCLYHHHPLGQPNGGCKPHGVTKLRAT
jgi:hypothetical protein